MAVAYHPSGSVSWWQWCLRACACAAFVMLMMFAGLCLMAPWVAPFDPVEISPNQMLPPFSDGFFLGTDHLGRDILSRLLYAGQRSFMIAAMVALLSICMGVLLGFVLGFVRPLKGVVMALPDVFLAVGLGVVLLLFVDIVLSIELSEQNMILILCFVLFITFAPRFAFIRRFAARVIHALPFVDGVMAWGARQRYIMVFVSILRHILWSVMMCLLLLYGYGTVALMALTAISEPSFLTMILVLSLIFAPRFISLSYGATIAIRGRCVGDFDGYVRLFCHVICRIWPSVMIAAIFVCAYVLLLDAGLAYFSISTEPPFLSWGAMLYEGEALVSIMPYLIVFAFLAIFPSVFSLQLIGDGLRDALDPRLAKDL